MRRKIAEINVLDTEKILFDELQDNYREWQIEQEILKRVRKLKNPTKKEINKIKKQVKIEMLEENI